MATARNVPAPGETRTFTSVLYCARTSWNHTQMTGGVYQSSLWKRNTTQANFQETETWDVKLKIVHQFVPLILSYHTSPQPHLQRLGVPCQKAKTLVGTENVSWYKRRDCHFSCSFMISTLSLMLLGWYSSAQWAAVTSFGDWTVDPEPEHGCAPLQRENDFTRELVSTCPLRNPHRQGRDSRKGYTGTKIAMR